MLLLLATLAALASARPAWAQDARELFRNGEEAYRVGDYAEAVRRWDQAYTLDPRPALLYNLGQAHERLGHLEQAIAALEGYLAQSTADAPGREDAAARLEHLRERVARTAIVIRSDVTGALVLVDGEERGRTPLPGPLAVGAGDRHVVVRRAGHRDFEMRVQVLAGTQLTIEPQFVPEAEVPAPAPVASTPTSTSTADLSSPARSESGGVDIAPWLLVGGGAVVAIVGGVLGGVALAEVQSAQSEFDRKVDTARTLAATSDVLVGVGAAVAVGGLVWAVVSLTSGSSDDEEHVHVAPSIGPGMAGITARGRF